MNKATRLYLFHFVCLCLLFVSLVSQTSFASTLNSGKTRFNFTILNSIGEPQLEAFIRVLGYSDVYKPDSTGLISFEMLLPENYVRKAELRLNRDKDKTVRSIELLPEEAEAVIYINTPEDVQRFKTENRQVTIEGMVQNVQGEPVPNAAISIQGTGKRTLSDEIGLFRIETDYNHPITVRASGMETRTLKVDDFIRNQEEAFNVVLHWKNSRQIYNVVDEMPEYRGGMKEFLRYLQRKAPYPEKLKKQKVEGVVVMQFVVEPNGLITNPKIVRRLHPILDTLAFAAIRDMPRWTPGKDGGMPVRCRYSTPVLFKVPKPQPVHRVDRSQFVRDSIMADSLRRCNMLRDSLRSDSISRAMKDSLRADSIRMAQFRLDSLRQDSIRLAMNKDFTVKKHRNAFVRFFRWLFGIERRERRRNARLMQEAIQNGELLPIKEKPALKLEDPLKDSDNTVEKMELNEKKEPLQIVEPLSEVKKVDGKQKHPRRHAKKSVVTEEQKSHTTEKK